MFERWCRLLVLCVLYSLVRPEKCPSHCTQDGDFEPAKDCGTRGLCCGCRDDLYCCVSYFDRINVSSIVDVVAEDCTGKKAEGGGSPPHALSQVLLVGLAASFSILTSVLYLR